MKNIIFSRVDDRLIHGEVVTAFVPTYSINHIIIIDDITASNSMESRIIKSLSPSGVQVSIFTVDEGIENLSKAYNEKERILILTKSPITFKELSDGGIELEEVNIGGMGLRDDRESFINNVAMDEEEVDAARYLKENGVKVYYQLVPEQKVINIDDLL